MRKYFINSLLAVFIIGLLAACGSSDDAEKDDEGAEDSESAVTTVEEGKLTFGSSGLYKPFNFEDLDGNETGFEVELGEAIAKEMGLEANPVFTQDFGALIEEVNSDRIDVIMGSLTITEERAEAVDFSDTYYTSGGVLFVHEDTDNITELDDLDGKEVGVVASSVYEDIVLENISDDSLATYQSDTIALQDLSSGADRLDVVMTDKLVGLGQIDENDLAIKEVGDFVFEEEIGAAVRKGNQELLDEINRALEVLIEDGTYEEISKNWFGKSILD